VPTKEEWARRAQQYERRAAEVRAIADGMHDEISKRTLYAIALDYERLAARALTVAMPADFPDPK
jgi:hypothetical protein